MLKERIREFIRTYISQYYGSAQDFALKNKIKPSTLYHLLSGRTDISVSHLERFAGYFNLEVNTLIKMIFFGMPLEKNDTGVTKPIKVAQPDKAGIPVIRMDDAPSFDLKDVRTHLGVEFFDREYLRGFQADFVVATQGLNKGMCPEIIEGDLLLIDRNPFECSRPKPKPIYLVNVSGDPNKPEMTVSRVQYSMPERIITLQYSNPELPAKTFSTDRKAINKYLLGKVVWIGRKLVKKRSAASPKKI